MSDKESESKTAKELLFEISKEEGKIDNNIIHLVETASNVRDNINKEMHQSRRRINKYEKQIRNKYNEKVNYYEDKSDNIKKSINSIPYDSEDINDSSNKQIYGVALVYFILMLALFFSNILPINFEIALVISLAIGAFLIIILGRKYIISRQYRNNLIDVSDEIIFKKADYFDVTNEKRELSFSSHNEEINEEHSRLVRVLNNFSSLVKETIPLVKDTVKVLDRESKYRYHLERFLASLNYFSINIPGIKSSLEMIPLSDEVPKWEQNYFDTTCDLFNRKNDPGINSIVVELFYREYIKDASTLQQIWRNKSAEIVKPVSQILFQSNLLPKTFNYSLEDLEFILTRQEVFDLEKIKDEIHKLSQIYDLTLAYQTFLSAHNIENKSISLIKLYETSIEIEKTEDYNLKLLLEYSKKIIEPKQFRNEDEMNGAIFLSLPMFYANDHIYREQASKFLESKGGDTAINLTYVLTQLTDIYGREHKTIPTLRDVVDNHDNIFDSKRNQTEETKKDIEILRAALANGEWLRSGTQLFFKRLEEINEKVKQIDENKKVVNAIKNLLDDVEEDTITRVLESQLFSAYLITFQAGYPGPIADDIIDGDLKTKYGYEKYTPGTRIGVIEEGMDFKEFKGEFEKDVKEKLKSAGRHKKTKVIIQKITPSEYTFKTVDFTDLPNYIKNEEEETPMDIIRKIIKKRSEGIFIPLYDRKANLMKILDHLSVYDLIEKEGLILNDTEKRVTSRPDLWNKIEEELGIKKDKIASRYQEKEWKSTIEKNLPIAISEFSREHKGTIDIQRCNQISKALINMLDTLEKIKDA